MLLALRAASSDAIRDMAETRSEACQIRCRARETAKERPFGGQNSTSRCCTPFMGKNGFIRGETALRVTRRGKQGTAPAQHHNFAAAQAHKRTASLRSADADPGMDVILWPTAA